MIMSYNKWNLDHISELMGINSIDREDFLLKAAAKIIETGRIGLSFLEKSSRYVRYDRKYNGRYLYLDFEKTGLSGKFKEKIRGDYGSDV